MRMCSGCQTKIPDDVRFCDKCKAERSPVTLDGIKEHTVTDRERYAFLYKSERWKRGISPRVLCKYPFCARCQMRISEIVDHVVPVGVVIVQAQQSGRYPFDKWAGFYLISNLQGLCRACHAIKTAEDKAHVGPWPDAVAKEVAAPKKVWSF